MVAEALFLMLVLMPALPCVQIVVEAPSNAVGDGTGILLVAHTSTGNRLASSALGEKKMSAEQVSGVVLCAFGTPR